MSSPDILQACVVWLAPCGAAKLRDYGILSIFPVSYEIRAELWRFCLQIDELHKMSAIMGPPTMQTWPEGVLLANSMGFSFNPQQPIPLHLMVRQRTYLLPRLMHLVPSASRMHSLGRHAEDTLFSGQQRTRLLPHLLHGLRPHT